MAGRRPLAWRAITRKSNAGFVATTVSVALHDLALLDLRSWDDADGPVFLARRAVLLRPEEPRALEILGRAYHARGEHQQAVDQFQAALRLRADDPSTLVHLGHARYALGELDPARKSLHRALKLDSELAEAEGARILLQEIDGSGSDS